MPDNQKYAFSVSVITNYLVEQSSEKENRFVFSYTVTITNSGAIAAQLISRHWIITDANQQVNEVKGLGVIGAQPLLKPNEQFTYSSGTVLDTSVGTMRGTYQVVAEDGTAFEAIIAPFTLAATRVLH